MVSSYCGSCGALLASTAAFCGQCGRPATPRATMTNTPPTVYAPAATPQPPIWSHPGAPMVTFGESVRLFFTNYANFSGRARRSEYWFSYLFVTLINLGLQIFTFVPSIEVQIFFAIIWLAWLAAIITPSLAVASRRLHDTDTSFGYFFLVLVPLVGPILVIIRLATDSTPGWNRFGASPKYQG